MNRFERKVSVLGWWNGRQCLLMPDAPTASKEYFRVPANRISLLHAFYISWFLLSLTVRLTWIIMKSWNQAAADDSGRCLQKTLFVWNYEIRTVYDFLKNSLQGIFFFNQPPYCNGKPDVTCHPDSLLTNWKLFGPNWLKRTPLPPVLEISHNSALDHLNCLIDQSILF